MQNTLPVFNRVLPPDRVPDVNPAGGIAVGDFDPNRDRLINPAGFAAPGPFRFGNSAPYIQSLRNNAFNRHRFGEVEGNFSNAAFGRVRSARFPRFVQLAFRIRF
jgi:hypothetical protein